MAGKKKQKFEVVKILRGDSNEWGYYDGNKFIRHRDDGPAVIRIDGHESWYQHGGFHREGAPSSYTTHNDPTKIREEKWHFNKQYHRIGGPAQCFFNPDGTSVLRWYLHGQLHREDGPAIESCGKTQYHLTGCGVCVPEHVVMAPETQTLKEIVKEENMEVRRIRMERFGWEKFFSIAKAKIIAHGQNDIEGTEESLIEVKFGSKENSSQNYFIGVCPSTRRMYPMEVPSHISNLEEARTFLSGLDPRKCIGAS